MCSPWSTTVVCSTIITDETRGTYLWLGCQMSGFPEPLASRHEPVAEALRRGTGFAVCEDLSGVLKSESRRGRGH